MDFGKPWADPWPPFHMDLEHRMNATADNNIPNNLGNRLKEARKARGKSQSWLAEKIGVTQGAISQLELGKINDLTATNLLRAALLLEVNPYWLALDEGTMESGQLLNKTNYGTIDLTDTVDMYTTLRHQIGRRLQAARKTCKWSLQKMCDQTTWLDKSRLGNWESGLRMIGLIEAIEVAKLLSVTPEHIYGLDETTLEEAQLMAKFRACDERGRTAILHMSQVEADLSSGVSVCRQANPARITDCDDTLDRVD
jgi:transcriptional regulator with XRE-family HTH domain